MDFFIEVPEKTGKVEQLIRLFGAEKIDNPVGIIPTDKALVAVVVAQQEIAHFVCNKEIMKRVQHSPYSVTWLLIDRTKVYQNILEKTGIDLVKILKAVDGKRGSYIIIGDSAKRSGTSRY